MDIQTKIIEFALSAMFAVLSGWNIGAKNWSLVICFGLMCFLFSFMFIL